MRGFVPTSAADTVDSSAALKSVGLEMHALTSENLAELRIFNDFWLFDQEAALTEILNKLLNVPRVATSPEDYGALRRELMTLYLGTRLLRMSQRLKASLHFGALALPQGCKGNAQASRVLNNVDIGRRFVQPWTETYKQSVLRAAIETVVGQRTSFDDSTVPQSSLRLFIERYLLHNADTSEQEIPSTPTSILWSWQRTILTSLMIFFLIDQHIVRVMFAPQSSKKLRDSNHQWRCF